MLDNKQRWSGVWCILSDDSSSDVEDIDIENLQKNHIWSQDHDRVSHRFPPFPPWPSTIVPAQALGGWKAGNFAAKITANEDSGSYSYKAFYELTLDKAPPRLPLSLVKPV